MNATYVIPAENQTRVEEKLAQLNRKAAKLGVAPVTIAFSHHHTETKRVYLHDDGQMCSADCRHFQTVEQVWLNADVTGEPVRVSGYEFLATIHHTSDGNILAAVPGFEVPREYRNAPSACHHCNTVRRRNATYLVRSEQGTVVQVGNSCLQDFLGNDPHRMAQWAEALGAFNQWFQSDSEEPRGGYVEPVWSLAHFLTVTATVIRKDGWVSKRRSMETEQLSTAATVMHVLTCRPTTQQEREFLARYAPEPADAEVTEQTLAFLATLAERADDNKNDYEHNLTVINRAGLVNRRTAGIAASAIAAWRRTLPRDDAPKATATPSAWVGKLTERLRAIPARITNIIELEPTEYGPRRLITMADAQSNAFTWFTGTMANAKVGDTFKLTGTVKRHGEYKGVKQTELTRCKLEA